MLQSNGYPSTRRALRQLSSSRSMINNENTMIFRDTKEVSLKNNENTSFLATKTKKTIDTRKGPKQSSLHSSSSKMSNTTTKTPRKALGNISNQNKSGFSSALEPSRTSLKPKGVSFQNNKTPHTLNTNKHKLKTTAQNERTLSKSTRNKKPTTNIIKSQTKKFPSQKSVSFDESRELKGKSKSIVHNDSKANQKLEQPGSPVDDIEYSAGRTWQQQQALLDDDIVSECTLDDFPITFKELMDYGRVEREEQREKEDNEIIKNLEEYAANLWLQDVDDLPLKSNEKDELVDEDLVGELEFSPIGAELDDDFFFNDDIISL